MTEIEAIKESLQTENPNYKNICILILESLSAMSARITEMNEKVQAFDALVEEITVSKTTRGRGGGPSIG